MRSAAERVAYRHVYARIFRAMSMGDALETLGFPPGSTPDEAEVRKAQRQLAIQHHPDRGGDPRKQVEINVAADILLGKARPERGGYGGGGGYEAPAPGGYGGGQPRRQRAPDVVVKFDEAKGGAVPSGTEWLFVTTYHSSGYSGDESTNRAVGWVAVGQTDNAWVFTAAENWMTGDYVMGGLGPQRRDIWKISSHKVPKGAPVTARLFYGEVMKAWKRFEHLSKKFNSKVVGADGWTFSSSPPRGNSLSIKNFLLNSGMMSEEALGGAPRKYEIKVHYEAAKFGTDRKNPPPGFFTPSEYSDPHKLTLIINGKDYVLPVRAMEKLNKLRVKGKDFTHWMFGEYYYGGETKVLTRKREGKQVMGWMAENLPGLPEWVETALKSASTAQPAKRRRRRW
jgi:hypothetical protein